MNRSILLLAVIILLIPIPETSLGAFPGNAPRMNATGRCPADSCSGINDTLHPAFRLVSSAHGLSRWMVRLDVFGSLSGKLWFYNHAPEKGIFMEDKNALGGDSAVFYTELSVSTAGESMKTLLDWFTAEYTPPAELPLAGEIDCMTAQVSCSQNTYTFPSGTTGTAPASVGGYPNYGCVHSTPGPAWYYMQVGSPGDIVISISQVSPTGTGLDVDFICWGPFTSLTDGCATGLTGTCFPSSPPNCCDNNLPSCQHFYPRGNIADCSYSGAANETCTIQGAQTGEIYILLITNFSHNPGTITFSQTGGSGLTNCNIVVFCSMISMTATSSACSETTNTFSVSGNVEFSNPPPGGILTVTDETAVPPVSQTLLPPFNSPLPFSLNSIPCDGTDHLLHAVFSDSTSCLIDHTITTPPPACPQAQISGGGSVCSNGSTAVPVSITLSGPPPYSFTWAVDGVPQPPVVNYPGPSPYVVNVTIPGAYTLVSVSNPGCAAGAISGSAIVLLYPDPVPAITGPAAPCEGSAGNVYTTQTGNTGYAWNISAGGIITAGGSGSNFATVTWTTSGSQWISVIYADATGCTPATPTSFPVGVKQNLPVSISVSGDPNPFCRGTSVTFTAVPVNGGVNPQYQWRVNGVDVLNAILPVFTFKPVSGDAVTCRLTSSESCVTGNPSVSVAAVQTAFPTIPAILTSCNDPVTTTGARPFLLRGGLPPGGLYAGPGVDGATGVFNPLVAGTGMKTIFYIYTDVRGCKDSASTGISVVAAPAFTCGNILTDVRDGQQYATFTLPNGKCWMQENLRYGTEVPDIQPQTDNCTAEKYLRPAAFTPRTSFYQWNELMQYAPGPPVQGLCPPAWHVPSSAEWDELIAFNGGPGEAGGNLKDQLFATGFKSGQYGVLYQNSIWSFTSGPMPGSMYWTSTPSGGSAVARGLNQADPSVSWYAASRSHAFSVRCLKD